MDRKEKMVEKTRVAVVCLVMLAVTCAASAEFGSDVIGIYDVEGLTAHQLGRSLTAHRVGVVNILGNSCDYDWWYGCSPTSAGMAMGHYDRNGYGPNPLTNKYPNLVPGGVAETETYVGPPTGSSALGNNAIASPGHIADFYVAGYLASGDDVAPPWHSFNCLADFMGTSQDAYGNPNGGTTFYYYTNGAPLYAADIYGAGASYYDSSGMFGIYEYVDYSGYGDGNPGTNQNFFNQYIDAVGLTYGFTFAQYKAEIDAGRPVLIHVEDHTMFGYGYDDVGNTVYLYDTWTLGPHTMPWGGTYSGLLHYGVTCIEVTNGVPEPATLSLLILGGLMMLRRRRRAC